MTLFDQMQAKHTHFAECVNTGDIEALADHWCNDGILLPVSHPKIEGKEAIVAFWGSRFANSRFRLTNTVVNVDDLGDTATVILEQTFTANLGDNPQTFSAKSLIVNKRCLDGVWRIHRAAVTRDS